MNFFCQHQYSKEVWEVWAEQEVSEVWEVWEVWEDKDRLLICLALNTQNPTPNTQHPRRGEAEYTQK